MVEGPGTTRNGRKASRLLTKPVRNLRIGSASSSSSSSSSSSTVWWKNRELSQVITIGKELFLIFSTIGNAHDQNGDQDDHQDQDKDQDDQDLALRVHFGMNGSLHVNKPTTQPRASASDPVTLEITFDFDILRTYRTNSVSSRPIPAAAPRRKYDKLHTHDVCSPTFAVEDVLDQLSLSSSSLSSTIISDILLNQNILPGIGNIIKIEGLHEARVHPKRPLGSFTRDELSFLITCCREYSIKWLETGRAPAKYVYNQTICGSCYESSIAICRLGGTDRTTFWCRRCQRLDPNPNTNTNANPTEIFEDPSRQTTSRNETNLSLSPPSSQERSMDSNLNLSSSSSSLSSSMARKVCPFHGPSKVILRRCKKKGVNEQRIFYTCKAARSCNFFCWADSKFPKCKCGKRVVMRVSKTEKSGGRWFFFCAKRGANANTNANGCGHFQWVDAQTLARFGHLLTPLL